MNCLQKIKIRPALPNRYRGKPEFCKDGCVGCAACAKVCPACCIEVIDDLKAKTRRLILRLDGCIFCASCQANCITAKGIRLSNNYDAASYEKSQMTISVEKRLLACDSCGSIVGAKDHLLFLAKKLGPLAYANPVLILANQAELKLGEYSLSSSSSYRPAAGRTIMFKVLCPNCRRLVILEDEKTDCQHL